MTNKFGHTLKGQWFWVLLLIPVEAGRVMSGAVQAALLVVTDLPVHCEILLPHHLLLLYGQTNFPMPPKQHRPYNSSIHSTSHGHGGHIFR